MSRYHDPEGMGGDPSSGERRAGSRGMPGDSGLPRRRMSFLGPHPILGAAAIISTVLVVGVSLVAYAAVRNVYDGINHEAVTAQMLGNRPPKLNGSTNILLICVVLLCWNLVAPLFKLTPYRATFAIFSLLILPFLTSLYRSSCSKMAFWATLKAS
jgi:hypothetical protein